jgi:outer membrane lipoprotein-sorting protein
MTSPSTKTAHRSVLRPFVNWRISAVFLSLAVLLTAGCARPPWPTQDDSGDQVINRMRARKSEISSATYRVRWEAQGTEPHSQFILEIAHRKPGRFRISATGPFGVPAFTAVVIEERFWFVDHHNGEYYADSIGGLDKYNMPLSTFFSGLWRDLFAGGGLGAEHVTTLVPTGKRNRYEVRRNSAQWLIDWNHGSKAPKHIVVYDETPEGTTVAETWFGHTSDALPYWEIERLELRGFPGGGRHRWKILKQTYNVDIPDRFFAPLEE